MKYITQWIFHTFWYYEYFRVKLTEPLSLVTLYAKTNYVRIADDTKKELIIEKVLSWEVEEVYMFSYETYRDVIKRIPYFIEEVYNKKRLHS